MGAYSNTRPESPKGQVYIAFSTQGHAAAREKAEALKVAGKASRWFKEWAGDEAKAPAGNTDVEASKAPVAPTKTKGKAGKGKNATTTRAKGRRVYDVGEPNVHGTVIEEGEQVSTVRWDAALPWGKEKHVPNDMLHTVEDEPSEHDRLVFLGAKAFRIMQKDKLIATTNSFTVAIAQAGDDCRLWVFAVSKGGGVALLMRPHWAQYEALLQQEELKL